MAATKSQLEAEVRELTEILRHSESCEGLRFALTERGVELDRTALVGLIGLEDNSRYGALLTADLDFIVFVSDAADNLVDWERAADVAVLRNSFEAVDVAVELVGNGLLDP